MKKVIELNEVIFERTLAEVLDILRSLQEEYDIPVKVRKNQITTILREFFDYYKRKGITYYFYEYMKGHFEDIAITFIENDTSVDIHSILEQLKLYELLDSPIEVNPSETKKVIQKIKITLERGPKLYEGKHH